MRLLQGVGAEGGCDCVEASAKFISKEYKNNFSIAHLLIIPTVLHK